MNLNEFNDNYLKILLQKISKEKKKFFLLGYYNVDLIKGHQCRFESLLIYSGSNKNNIPKILHS